MFSNDKVSFLMAADENNKTRNEIMNVHFNNQRKQHTNVANRVKGAFDSIELLRSFYRDYLQSDLTYESPNVYKFSFVCEEAPPKWIKFQHEERSKTWDGYEPPNLIGKEAEFAFEETQDTQQLLSNIRNKGAD